MAPVTESKLDSNAKSNYDARFKEVLKETPIVDTHNDFPYLLRVQLRNELHVSDNVFSFNGELTSHTSLPKFKKGGVGIQFFSCFIECPNDNYLYQDFNVENSAVRDTIEQIDVTTRMVKEYGDDMKFVTNSTDALDAYQNEGKIAVTLGVEGLHQVDTSLGVLRKYFDLGVRYITLTHNCDNPFATAASSVTAGLPDKGLTDYGRACVKEMNRLGMIVDLSHVSYKTMVDALETSVSPVMFSHSSAYSITNHPRNVPDDILLKLRDNDGVCCVNFCPFFIEQKGHEPSIDDALDHILHIVNITGSWKHVGLGSDFDGIPSGPKGLEDVSKYPDLVIKCMERGASNEDVSMLMGKNVLRVWKANEEKAKSLSDSDVVEANWKERVWAFNYYGKDLPEIFPGSFDIYGDKTEWKTSVDLFPKADKK